MMDYKKKHRDMDYDDDYELEYENDYTASNLKLKLPKLKSPRL